LRAATCWNFESKAFAKPADLPVQQSAIFELVVRADEMIE
jgi:hypothetical protein